MLREIENQTRADDSAAVLALLLAGVLGVLADRFFYPEGPQGPGFALWIALLGGAAVLEARRSHPASAGAVAGWSAVSTVAAAAMMLRDTEVVMPMMWLVLLTSASMVLLRSSGVRLWSTRPIDHVLALAWVPGRAAMGVLPLVMDLEPPPDSSRRRFGGLVRGALLAAPLLLVFGALFASADAGFDRYLVRMATFWSEDGLTHVLFVLGFGWIAAGLLSGVRAKRLPDPLSGFVRPRLGPEETGVVLGLLALLFLTFVGFQLGYLFGGREVIESTSGLTVADYARRGFFEMVVVGVGTIGVLLIGDAVTTARRLFRVLAVVLIVCVLIIFTSAVQRLMLYTGEFGLTVDRITAAAIMAWVAAVLILFAATVLRDRPARFSSAALVAGIVTAFALVLMNPAQMAARSNLDRAARGVREADVAFLTGLGGDAVPAILERIDELPAPARCALGRDLLSRWTTGADDPPVDRDWRTWNAGRAAARAAVEASRPRLQAAASGC
ncbi:MAG: DUF4153 domain-containing protein [Gemmatimonadales bacterium]